MKKNVDILSDENLAWLRYALSPQKTIPEVSDWRALFDFADKQKIIGVCDPTKHDVKVGVRTLSLWLGMIQQIKHRSALLNKRVGELYGLLEEAGFRCCILKGQGNAEMYPDPFLRMPGDIDVWIDDDEQAILQFVKERFSIVAKSYKHIKFPVFDDVPVDVHVTPLKFFCPIYHKRLQHWINKNKKEQFEHHIHLTGIEKKISVPTARFNVVYQLGHMLIHLYDEGVGLRHLVDYYYVLNSLNASDTVREELNKTFASLGMMRFAKAVMWIEQIVLGLPADRCIVDTDEKHGQQLLIDILDGGNFGQYSQRYKGKKSFMWRGMVEAKKVLLLSYFAPCEAFFRLFHKMKTAVKHFV